MPCLLHFPPTKLLKTFLVEKKKTKIIQLYDDEWQQ